jgi:hypothetical protein
VPPDRASWPAGWALSDQQNLRIELLDTIKAETVTAFESSRQRAEPMAA